MVGVFCPWRAQKVAAHKTSTHSEVTSQLRHVLTTSVMSRHKSRNTAWMLVTSKGMVPEVFEGILKSFKSWRVPEGSWGSLEILESLLEVLVGTWKSLRVLNSPWKSLKFLKDLEGTWSLWKSLKSLKVFDSPWKLLKISDILWKFLITEVR